MILHTNIAKAIVLGSENGELKSVNPHRNVLAEIAKASVQNHKMDFSLHLFELQQHHSLFYDMSLVFVDKQEH